MTTKSKTTIEPESTELITVEQLPIIRQRLELRSAEIKQSINEALSMVCTEETVKIIKIVRANLTKEFKELEDQRKQVKAAIMAPYLAFEAIYKANVTDLFNPADEQLKEKIASVEDGIKAMKEEDIREYFDAYLASKPEVTFVTFDRVGLNITKSANTEALKRQCAEFVDQIASDLKMIALQPDQAEILVEYEASLNASQSITTIADKHARIAAQQAAIADREAKQKAFEEANRVREEAQAQVAEYLEESPKTESAPVAWVVFVNSDGEIRGREYSYLVPDDTDYRIGEILEIETKNGMTHGQIAKFGTIDDVPDNVVPFLKYLPKKIDAFVPPVFIEPEYDILPPPIDEEPNERAGTAQTATLRIAIVDTVERIDALIAALNAGGYCYDEI